MKIAVFGSGGVGGYFGGKLAASGEDVTFLARGAHLAAMQRDGLHIASPLGDVRVPNVQATDRPQAIGPVDVVLLTVKLYDVDAAAATLAPLIGSNTVVITLQNGVDAMDMVAKHVGEDHVAGGAAYIVAVIDRPGHIRHTVAQQLAFGERDGRRSDRLARFEDAGLRAGFQAKVSTDVEAELWVKFVRLASWSGMTAATRSSLGVLRDHPETFAMMVAAIEEVIAVGHAKGVSDMSSLGAWTREQFDPQLDWDDVEWIKKRWGGKLVLKGVLDAEDARHAVSSGADAIVVSNHGGRQLDGAPSSISALPAIADAVGSKIEVWMDGGIRSGQDLVKAWALGARGTLIGRAFVYGLGAMGQAGVSRALEVLRNEADLTMAFCGHTDIHRVDRSILLPGTY